MASVLPAERGLASVRSTSGDDGKAKHAAPSFTAMVNELKKNFASRETYSLEWRLKELAQLRRGLVENEALFVEAVKKDLRRPTNEAFLAEVALTVAELDFAVKNLKEWMAPERLTTPLTIQPATFELVKQPKGVALIIGPWNYPTQLVLAPLVAAIAAGCPAVLKPSEMTPASAAAVDKMVRQYLDPKYFRVVLGAVAETTALLKEPWGHIFYTGNGAVGRVVYKAAAEHLTSVTLELGGKSPVYVAADANLDVAARRIISTKLFNNGQTCVAPDYVLVEEKVRDALLAKIAAASKDFYGANPQKSPDIARIVNNRHFNRIKSMLEENHGGKVVMGGLTQADEKDLYLPPTIVVDPKRDSRLMEEEIFGPVLPVVTVRGMSEALGVINSKEPSLASYIFTEDRAKVDEFVRDTVSGGTTSNDLLFALSNPYAPFGGTSASGLGSYHGKFGFDQFTHFRTLMVKATWIDPKKRYPPYDEKDIATFRKIYIGPFFPPHVVTAMKVMGVAAVAAVLMKSKL